MRVFEKVVDLQSYLNELVKADKKIGFVPSMGALHEGHVSLVTRCVAENDVCVVSIFVNPAQFNDPNDLKNYPRNLEEDLNLLRSVGCDVVFAPTEKEVYPTADTTSFDLGFLDTIMEGKHRPGHFQGVAKVVHRLFEIVKPHTAYFGEKDFQQIAVIRRMVNLTGQSVNIVSCPIIRESDGLALSSRNLLLTPEHRKSAPLIAKTLSEAKRKKGEVGVIELKKWVVEQINSNPLLEVEYFEIVNFKTLEPITTWHLGDDTIGCITVKAGNIRLIDNIKFDSK
ncbi:pantoate--beta-alanine ligase [Williamwhitmania taraxaci]|uniref:Pantothenate synthetase n=1 Tax=Williamwhitmania taraxaci TaxID=1640674 RepID=A0A1G6MYE1_9BACT|nr:pantoate--beta-alanine ligase [Williamwhitmania taraxaci]SDC60590.1 pantoate--beta-alanine ligase [Williamwhitmania taraxaci]